MRFVVFSILIYTTFFITPKLEAQDWNWGDDIVTAKGNWAYFRNLVSAKKYEEASVKIPWFITNTPDLNENLYIKAAQAYEGRVATEKVVAKKEILKDSALMMYDLRMKYYPENKANIMNRKGLLAWNYLSRREGVAPMLYALYDSIYVLNGDDMYLPNATAWMFAAVLGKQKGVITEQELLEVYGAISDYLEEQRIRNADNDAYIAQIDQNGDLINRKFLSAVNFGCDDFESLLGEKFRSSKDIKLAKRIQNMMFRNGCTSAPLFKEVLTFVLENEPNAEGYKYMAYIYSQEKKYTEAIAEYEKALEYATSNKAKANICMEMARLYNAKGQKSTARSNAMKAVNLGGNAKEAYTFIGDLYYASFEQCQADNILISRAVYIAAYNMYEKAGDAKKMADAKDQFPSMEEIHQRNKSLGDKIEIGCWINETVSLQKR